MKKRASAADRLVPLGALDGYRLADEEPDIRGWPVVDAAGESLGVVRELFVDTGRGDIAAAEVAGPSGAGVRLLPMENARVDPERRVVATTLRAEQLAPVSDPTAPADAAGSDAVRSDAARSDAARVTVERTADGGEIVRVPIVREELVVERRPVVKEVIVIRKRAAREEQVVEADLRRERLEVDRRDL